MTATTTPAPERPQPADPTTPRRGPGGRRLLTGGAVLAGAMTVANGGNYLLNLLLGRWMAPAAFADASLVVTLLLVLTAAAAIVQLVAAQEVGRRLALAPDHGPGSPLRRPAWRLGLVLGAALAAGAPVLQDVFHTASAVPFVVLGAGLPFYLAQAAERGVLQGRLRFGRLAGSFLVEMAVRLGATVALVAAGFGVPGVALGLSASFVATWLVARERSAGAGGTASLRWSDLQSLAAPAFVLLCGQIVINNGDVILAKHYFSPTVMAGYAAVALVGRAVFFATWAVVNVVVPVVARRHAAGEDHERLLAGAVVLVTGVSGILTAAAFVAGGEGLTFLFGARYAAAGPLLGPYALATSLFAVANLVATARLAAGRIGPAVAVLAGGAAQTAGIFLLHDRPLRVIQVQIVAMGLLLAATALLGGRSALRDIPRRLRFGAGAPSGGVVPARP